MRHAVLAVCIAAAFAIVPRHADAQSALVDLSTPQPGKSRFVLNADLSPADLGAAREEKSQPAMSRVPACGEGCVMQQPEVPREPRYRYSYSRYSYSYQTDGRTRIIFVSDFGSRAPQQTATQAPAPAPRKTFRFRRR